MSAKIKEVAERDEAGNLAATYVFSRGSAQQIRVDTIKPEGGNNLLQSLVEVFLPAGYPHSVTDDYTRYQIYDSLQAFSSSIAGLLSSRAVLEGVGVGDATASPTAALLLSIVQESIGRVATITFAWRLGSALEPECKRFRLLADVFNDCAFVMDCLSPALPKGWRIVLLSLASTLRALCGVAAGSSKASLSAHFAKRGNLAELNAKDSSQETVISLLGMLAGSVVVSRVTTGFMTWSVLFGLLAVHLGTNYAAVRAVQMLTLNRQRANILFSTLLEHGRVLSPAEVSATEKVFERDGILRWGSQAIGHAYIGVRMKDLLQQLASTPQNSSTGSVQGLRVDVETLFSIFEREGYLLWFDARSRSSYVVLKQEATPEDALRAWLQSLLVARRHHDGGSSSVPAPARAVVALRETLDEARSAYGRHRTAILQHGWDLASGALETASGTRVAVETGARPTQRVDSFEKQEKA